MKMKSYLIGFCVIVMVNARPSDYDDIAPSKLSYGLKYSEQDEYSEPSDEHESPNSYSASGIYTKYPDNSQDDYQKSSSVEELSDDIRSKRQTSEKDASIDVNKHEANEIIEIKRAERKTPDQKISLRSFISSVESDLVSQAQLINTNIRLRRSLKSQETSTKTENNGESSTVIADLVDQNKDLFDGIFEYTRPQRETENKDTKIPLDGLVQAVENTFINSAQKLKEPNEMKLSKREADTQRNKRDVDEPLGDKLTSGSYQVKKLTSSNIHDLNILNPITFKTVNINRGHGTTETNLCNDDQLISTTELAPIQRTNLSLVQSSNTVHLVPGADQKLAHVQHQQIQKTIFYSNLAIFPTISPQLINAPLIPTTTATEYIGDTTTIASITEKVNLSKQQKLSENAEKLKEKIAEIQAEPVILTQF